MTHWKKKVWPFVEACKHFLPYLVGKKFCVVTDNHAPQYLYNKDPTTGHLARWLDARRDLDFKVRHRPGTSNGNEDELSRQAWSDEDSLQKEERTSGSSHSHSGDIPYFLDQNAPSIRTRPRI